MLLVSMMLLQLGGGLSAQAARMLTLGYAIAIVAFIRVGEKLLQKFGARKPMIWGSLIVGLSIAMLMPTNLLIEQYTILAVVSYTLFGLGVAFYATPSTDAALSNLPDDQAGSGSGLYKMASSLGASFGVATSYDADRQHSVAVFPGPLHRFDFVSVVTRNQGASQANPGYCHSANHSSRRTGAAAASVFRWGRAPSALPGHRDPPRRAPATLQRDRSFSVPSAGSRPASRGIHRRLGD
jgi:hypothetical protein